VYDVPPSLRLRDFATTQQSTGEHTRISISQQQHHSPPFPQQLQGLLTLFTEFFASFDCSTCALSVPGLYASLPWIHMALQTAVPSHSTPGYHWHNLWWTPGTHCGVGLSPSLVIHSSILCLVPGSQPKGSPSSPISSQHYDCSTRLPTF